MCVRCPRYFFAPDADRVPELCLALLNGLPHEELQGGHLPFWNFRLGDGLRREFGLVAIQHFTQLDDERERKLRAWERDGWREMSHGQMDEAWDRLRGAVRLPRRRAVPHADALGHLGHRPGLPSRREYRERVEADLTRKALAALKECTRPGEEVLALDWNHPCYFFDPHAASRPPWPVPVLPDGDHYIFLARDHRFGIVGNCVDMTVCVFGPELLAAFDASRPAAFGWPTWTAEARRANEDRWAGLGWHRLTTDEKEDIWERFDSRFGFYQSRFDTRRPGHRGANAVRYLGRRTGTRRRSGRGRRPHADTPRRLAEGREAGGEVIRPRPAQMVRALHLRPAPLGVFSRDSWAVSVNPGDGFAIFLAPDLRFGVVGNPVERTICIFGEELLAALGDDMPAVFGSAVRRNGVAGVV